MLNFEIICEDDANHVVLTRAETLSPKDFESEFPRRSTGPRKEAILFVHGYNTSFEDAARASAQLSYDLGFGGVTAFYSWPSAGHLEDYDWDEDAVEFTVPHLRDFIEILAREGHLDKIHVIAHSMGNRCATKAIAKSPTLERANSTNAYLRLQILTLGFSNEYIARGGFESRVASRSTLQGAIGLWS